MLIALDDDELAGAGRTAEDVFVRQMKHFRAARGLSQAELADRVAKLGGSLYQQTIAKIEAGQRAVRLQEADQIAQALGATVTEMLADAIEHTEGDPEKAEAEDLFSQLQAALRRRASAREEARVAADRERHARREEEVAKARAVAAVAESARAAAGLATAEAMVSELTRVALRRQSELNARYGPGWREYIDPRNPVTVGMLREGNLEHLNRLEELARSGAKMNSNDRAQLMMTIKDLRQSLRLDGEE